ncbi:MAG: Gldg family protein, partial [Candidatus Latescibacterota bacterium]
MRRRFLLQAGLVLLLLLVVVVQVDRLLGLPRGGILDLGDTAPGTLAPGTVAFLRDLDQPLSITCFLTFDERLPPHLKNLEGSVRVLLAAMERQAPGLVTWRVIDPDLSGTAGAEYAARHRVSPIKVRRVVRDETSEQTVWSSMVLALGDYPELLIQDITPAQLPRLEELIVAQLQALRAPPRPVFAVATPPGYEVLRGTLANYGEVIDLDLDGQPDIPAEADLLFWVQPERVTTEHRRRLRRFVASGRSVVLAGSAYAIDCVGDDGGQPAWQARALPQAWHDLLQPLGLTPTADLLLDRGTGPLTFPCGSVARTLEPSFALRCLPAFYNQRSFLGPARGGLSFGGASPLAVDPGRAAREGFEAEIVATTTDRARVVPLPEGRFTERDLGDDLPVPKQNLMVLLHPQEPGQGQILVLASPALLQDGRLDDPAYAHPIFLRTLVRTFAEPRRLVWGRLEKGGPQPLTVPGGVGRLFWRLAASLAVPLALLVLGLRRSRVSRPLPGEGTRRGSPRSVVALATILGIALLTGFIRRGPALDLSNDDLNTPASLTRALLERYRSGLTVELISSPRAELPAPIRQAQERAADLLTGHGVPLHRLAPEGLAPEARQQLAIQGLHPFVVERVTHDSTSTRPIWSALRLQRGDAHTAIPRLDGETSAH